MPDREPLNPEQLQTPHELTKTDAEAFARYHHSRGTLVMWCITTNTTDFGKRYVARPILTPEHQARVESGYLVADSLDEIRNKLPYGLTRIDRHPTDSPVIVETWF